MIASGQHTLPLFFILSQYPFRLLSEATVRHCHQKPGNAKCQHCGGRYLQIQRNTCRPHQYHCRPCEEVVYHIDSKTAKRQVGQCFYHPLRTNVHSLCPHKYRNSHHHHVQRTVGEEQFQHFIRKVRQCRHVAETEESNRIAHHKHRNAYQCGLPYSPIMVAQIMSQKQVSIKAGKIIKHAE